MTWHDIMSYAHQGIEIKPLPGIPAPPARAQTVAEANKAGDKPPPRPRLLSKRGADALVRIEHMMDDASRALGPVPTVASEARKEASVPSRGVALTDALEGRAFVRN
jgi:penicillin-binding protein 1A